MMRDYLVTICLLVTQILFVNLGESLHTIPELGFHSADAPTCSCGCPHDTHPAGAGEDDVVAFDQATGDCPFCDFFESYFGTHLLKTQFVTGEFYRHYDQLERAVLCSAPHIFYWSRGPPTRKASLS